MKRTVALVPTAGTGERFGAALPKPLVDLCGKPVIAHTLAVLEAVAAIEKIVLIVHADFRKDYAAVVARYGFRKVCALVDGGATRTQSVRNGLEAVGDTADLVLVHDGVRPLVTVDVVARGLALAETEKAVVAGVPVKPTLKVVDPKTMHVRETLDRTLIWEIQTPQIFDSTLFRRAYATDTDASDDAGLVEQAGVPVKIFQGDFRNIKITTPEDLVVAAAFLPGKA